MAWSASSAFEMAVTTSVTLPAPVTARAEAKSAAWPASTTPSKARRSTAPKDGDGPAGPAPSAPEGEGPARGFLRVVDDGR